MTMDIATLGIRVDATEARLAAIELEKLSTAGGKTAKAMSSVEKSMQGLTGLFAGLGLGALAKSVLDTNREMESLRASLKSVMGSAQGAQGAFNAILTFAKDTPYEIKGLTQTFIMLQNMGIKPTHQVMQALTDQASKLGGSQETLTSIALQLGQAHSKGKLQMEDMVVLMERGVPVMKLLGQVTGKNAAELADMSAKGTITVDMIDKLIVKMGEAASGSNANAMETLNGKISSLSDAWHSFEDTLLNDKSEGYLKTVVSNWTAWLDYFKDSIAGVGKEFLALEEINNKIVSSKAKISAMSQGGVSGAAWQVAGALTGNSLEGEKNRLSDFIKQREGVIKTTHDVIVAKNQETAATDKLLNSTNEEKKALEQTLQSKKEQEKAAKAAAREQAALAKTFEDTVTSLSLHNIELSKTPRQLEEATLASKGLNKAQIEQAMALWEVGKALEAKKQLNEQEKSQLDSLIDRYNKATMSAREYYSSTLTTTSPDGIKSPMSGADKAPLLAQFDKTTGAEAATKAHEDAKTALDDYNKSLDDARTKTQDLGAVTSAIFDGALGGISLLVGAFTAMTDEITKNTTEMTRLNEEKQKIADFKPQGTDEQAAKFKAEKKNIKELSDLDKKSVQDQMTGARQLAGAASKLFAEKSAGAKAFHAIEVGIAVAQLAMRAKDMAMSAIATVKNIAEGASKMFAQSGWLGFAGVAAMLALMAGLGAMASGGGGSDKPPPEGDTGKGTVLGDPNAVSESIGKTNALLKTIHASEYVELRGINKGVNNLQNAISKTVDNLFQTGGMANFQPAAQKNPSVLDQLNPLSGGGLGAVVNTIRAVGSLGLSIISDFIISKIPILGSIMSSINRFFFGGKVTKSVVGQGIATVATPLQSVIDGGNVGGYQYANIKTHTSGGLFTKSKDKYSMQYQALSPETQKSFNDIFSSVGDTIASIADALGKGIKTDLMPRVMSAIIPAMSVELMGLSGEDAAKKLNGVISAMMDTMTTQIFGDIVGKYQKLGETMLETTVRIVSEIVIVKDALNQSGLSISTDIIAVSDALVQAAGGLEKFQAQFESFFDKFYSGAEKQTRLQKTLVGSLAEANVILPTTRENYKKLVEGLNMTNPLDQQRYSLLLELSEAADKYYSMLESGAADAAKIAKTQRSLDIQYMELTGNAVGALTEKRKDELAAMDASLRITQQGVYILADANKAVSDATAVANKAVTDAMALASKAVSAAVNEVSKAISNLSSLAQKLRAAATGTTVTTDATTRKDRADAQAVLNAALKVANAGGSIDNFAGMDKALTDISKPSEQLYSSFTDYARDQALTSGTITQLADYADAQVSMAQQQIDAINGVSKEVIRVNNAIVTLTGSADGTKSAVIDVDGQLVTLTRSQAISADGTTQEVTKVNGKIVDLIGSADGTKSAVIDVNGKMITLTSSQITSALGITDSVANLTEAQKNLATVQDQKTQIEKMLGNNLAVISVSEAIDQLAGSLNAQNAATKAIALATAADKAATKADLALIQANTKAKASALGYTNAKPDWEMKTKNANTAVTDSTAAIAKFTAALPDAKATYLYWATMDTNQGWDGKERDAYRNNLAAAATNYTNTVNGLADAQTALVNANAAVVAAAELGKSLVGLLAISIADRKAADLALAFYKTARAYADATAAALPAFASGGQHEGGWRIVGENGPELEKTGASRIFSNPQSKSLLSMDELLTEIRQLREDARANANAVAKNTAETSRIINRWDGDGMPAVRITA